MKCPFCDADKPQLISLFGSQLLFSQYRCGACGTYFEGLREDREEPDPPSLASEPSTPSFACERGTPSFGPEPEAQSPVPAREAPRPSRESASLQRSLLSSSEPEARSPNP